MAQVKGQKAVMLLALLQLGLREKDLFSLKWGDIDFKGKRVNVPCHDIFGADIKEWQGINGSLLAALEWWKKRHLKRRSYVFMYGRNPGPKAHTHKGLKNKRVTMAECIARWSGFIEHICRKAGLQAFTSELVRDKIESIIFITDDHGAILMFDHPKIIRKARRSRQKTNKMLAKRQVVGKAGATRKSRPRK